jgi:hypothetical protein
MAAVIPEGLSQLVESLPAGSSLLATIPAELAYGVSAGLGAVALRCCARARPAARRCCCV